MKTTGIWAFGKKNLSPEQKDIVDNYLKYARTMLSDEIIKMARKMNLDINEIFKNMLFSSKRELYESSVSNFLGVYGNYYATEYLSKRYSKVENEKAIETNKGLTVVDICFIDGNIINLCEVKVVIQLLLSLNSYKEYSTDNLKREDFVFSNGYSQKRNFVSAGKKLLKQIEKLVAYREQNDNIKVNFITFKDCFIDPKIIKRLNDLKVEIITIPIGVHEILDKVNNDMANIYKYGKDLLADNYLTPVS
ncbi:MAG: hypothetical protein PHD10_01000 [Bacilli bacterium]|nr:hypothetical protein [Bacilli bacterium]MDD4607699.1 hypothetical protein [Bacilli bacterium]